MLRIAHFALTGRAACILALAIGGAVVNGGSVALAQPTPATEQEDASASPVDLRMQAYALYPGGGGDRARAIELFTQAAELGDGDSMAFLGSIYLTGAEGVEANRTTAIDWYLKAAQLGNAAAIAKLAELAATPGTAPAVAEPVPEETAEDLYDRAYFLDDENEDEAPEKRALFQRAAAMGHVESMVELAHMFSVGSGGPRSSQRALYWYRQAAADGSPWAMYWLGKAYHEGEGVTQDAAQAIEWYELAAAENEEFAMLELGIIYLEGELVEQDLVLAKSWLEKAEDFGSLGAPIYLERLPPPTPDVLYAQAAELAEGDDSAKTEGQALFLQNAQNGHVPSMSALAAMLAEAGDGPGAVEWYLKAAQAGDADAIAQLAALASAPPTASQAAEPPVVDPATAQQAANRREAALSLVADGETEEGMALMLEAAEMGDAAAMGHMGVHALGGRNVAQSRAQAREWFEKGVAAGDILSMVRLAGVLHFAGTGTADDKSRARELIVQARTQIEALDFKTHAERLVPIAEYLIDDDGLGEDDYGGSLLRRLADSGSTAAMLSLAASAGDGKDRAEWLLQAAEAGNAVAMRMVSQELSQVEGFWADPETAAYWMAKSAEAGDEEAKLVMEMNARVDAAIDLYSGGTMSISQTADVLTTLEEGVAAGHLEATYWLGWILLDGTTQADAQRGFALMNTYVEKGGDEYGMAAIAEAYETGDGVSQNLDMAVTWFERAVDNGYPGQADIERVQANIVQPLEGTATRPPTDRWGLFKLNGDHAAGISSGSAYFAFACTSAGSLYLEYQRAGTADPALYAFDEVWLVLKVSNGSQYAMSFATFVTNMLGNYRGFNDAISGWMDAAAAANSIELAVTGDLNDWNYEPYNSAAFSARGSSNSIRVLRGLCSGAAALQ